MKPSLVRHGLALVLLAAATVVLASAAPAAVGATFDPLHPFGAISVKRAGIPAPAARQAALARMVAAQTGLALSQVKAQPVCPPTALGHGSLRDPDAGPALGRASRARPRNRPHGS